VPRENLPEVRQASREAIAAFVADYNHLRYHESISNLMGIDTLTGGPQKLDC
jgi:hypothetical protein